MYYYVRLIRMLTMSIRPWTWWALTLKSNALNSLHPFSEAWSYGQIMVRKRISSPLKATMGHKRGQMHTESIGRPWRDTIPISHHVAYLSVLAGNKRLLSSCFTCISNRGLIFSSSLTFRKSINFLNWKKIHAVQLDSWKRGNFT